MKSKYIFLLFSLLFWGNLLAQNRVDTVYIYKTDTIIITPVYSSFPGLGACPLPELKTNNAISASIGFANMYDTYLSPLEYKGFSIHLMYEQMRRTRWFNYKFYKQQVFELDFSKGDNPAKNVTEYWGLLSYRIGGHYSLYNTDAFRLGVGGLWDINVGALYNERNGNNPATARGYTNLNLSAIASYKYKRFAVRWQLDTPFMGMLFSPRYGQSYYEISLGNTVEIVNFASFHNQRALRNYLSVDIPINKYTIRVGYLGSWYQTKVHNIQTHHYTNSFVIGFPIEGVKRSREKAENNYWNNH
ncbi:DUF3316 domain-containing protein [Prevotella sp. 10(H)]|uniref:DUF3316 domain-containing protein n=1 Tax=Prevotella sp. 10(H) TaxID=1158294 RepID=UPI0009DD2A5E|nr:DUF3316 domain-containing protein [Prevotella sp. 10(H)]